MDELEKIKFKLEYNPKTRNVKKPVCKCIYGKNDCWYHGVSFKYSENCPFKNQTYCNRYLSERCSQWQLMYNKRFKNQGG